MKNEFPHERKQRKHNEAEERNAAWRSLSPQEQIASLDERLGKDIGATKQRERISSQLGVS